MPPIPYKTPEWVDPENASVLDSWWTVAARSLGRLAGLDDPNSQVLGMLGEVAAGPAQGGLAKLAGKAIKAYHGSPHDFEKFSLGKIGTGEGAQAYGHGLYFAENEAVAKEYRDQLSQAGGEVKLANGRKFDASNPAHDAGLRVLEDGSQDKALTRLRLEMEQAADFGDQARVQALARIQDHVTSHPPEVVFQAHGRMYEVAIHADPNTFLDWDAPLSQQSPQVRDSVLNALGVEPQAHEQASKLSGATLYHRLAGDTWPSGAPRFSGKQKGPEAAEVLRKAGVSGIKYHDAGSRAAGEGTRNYVVFDDQTVDVLRKYGLLGAIGGGLTLGSIGTEER